MFEQTNKFSIKIQLSKEDLDKSIQSYVKKKDYSKINANRLVNLLNKIFIPGYELKVWFEKYFKEIASKGLKIRTFFEHINIAVDYLSMFGIEISEEERNSFLLVETRSPQNYERIQKLASQIYIYLIRLKQFKRKDVPACRLLAIYLLAANTTLSAKEISELTLAKFTQLWHENKKTKWEYLNKKIYMKISDLHMYIINEYDSEQLFFKSYDTFHRTLSTDADKLTKLHFTFKEIQAIKTEATFFGLSVSSTNSKESRFTLLNINDTSLERVKVTKIVASPEQTFTKIVREEEKEEMKNEVSEDSDSESLNESEKLISDNELEKITKVDKKRETKALRKGIDVSFLDTLL